tara:strand:- start:62 stop:514 length:453 start_codon:yes stop_codon:yes gene_type:complete
MNINNILRTVTYILIFISIFIGTNSFRNGDYTKGLREIMTYGVIPMALSATVRHIFLSESIIKGGRFFEFEAGGSNLAFAVASTVAILKKMNNNVLGIIFLMYAIYLFMGSLAWYLFNPKNRIIIWLLKFWSIGGAFAYFSYIAFYNPTN